MTVDDEESEAPVAKYSTSDSRPPKARLQLLFSEQ